MKSRRSVLASFASLFPIVDAQTGERPTPLATSTERRNETSSIAVKLPCRVATLDNITLSGEQTIDDVKVLVGDRVLVRKQASAVSNGIYVANTRAWSRAPDFDGAVDAVQGALVVVEGGSAYGRTIWRLTAPNEVHVGKDALTFEQMVLEDAATTAAFMQAGTGAVLRTAQSKMRELVSVLDFGATGDGVTDDTGAVHRALDYCTSVGAELYFPAGVYRVTSGYTQRTKYRNIFLRGCGRVGEPASTSLSSMILLDTADVSSHFLHLTVNGDLAVQGLVFKCSQAVVDRPFFKFSSLNPHFITNCDFEDVERPFVYGSASYFQMAAYRDVQFRNSGTFHSENSTLACTFMLIDNVNHEGTIPKTNTEKIVCNLTGCRQILANNFLLEGSLPSVGWTVLKLSNPYNQYEFRIPFAIINNFHSEWSGSNRPAFHVDQNGGTVKFVYGTGWKTTEPYRITSQGVVVMEMVAFTNTNDDPLDYFTLEDNRCIVNLQNCQARSFDPSRLGIHHFNTQAVSSVNGVGQITLSNRVSEEFYRWDGGYFLAGPATGHVIGRSQSATPSTDATYKRRMILIPDHRGMLRQSIVLPLVASAGEQITVLAKARLPTFASGQWAVIDVTAGAQNNIAYSTSSGQVVDARTSLFLLTDIKSLTVSFTNGTTAGATDATTFDLLDLAVFVGNDVPRRLKPSFPRNISTTNTAAPVAGTWVRGDMVWNAAPSPGGAVGWVCTSAGTPGTWKALANVES